MSTATLEREPLAAAPPSARRGQLALALQEAFTAAVRLRSNRQVAADASSFRSQVKQLLSAADQRARAAGYPGETVKLAVYAFVAFLDETVLNSTQPMFAEWPRQPLQEEIFGDHMAGETFFRNLRELLGREDSEDLADLLEVHQLCLLLGFRGRYGGDDQALRSITGAVQAKIQRIRGAETPFSPSWRLPEDEQIQQGPDPWARRLTIFAGATLAVALILFILYWALLRPGVAEIRTLVAG